MRGGTILCKHLRKTRCLHAQSVSFTIHSLFQLGIATNYLVIRIYPLFVQYSEQAGIGAGNLAFGGYTHHRQYLCCPQSSQK